MKKNDENKYLGIVSGVIITFFLVWFFAGYFDKKKKLSSENIAYAITEISEHYSGSYGIGGYKYFIYIKGNKYKGSISLGYNSYIRDKPGKYNYYVGKNYLVKFSKDNPKYNELLFDKPVSDSLLQCCRTDIWDELPF